MFKHVFLGSVCVVLFVAMALGSVDAIRGSDDVTVFNRIADGVQRVHKGQEQTVQSEYPPLASVLFYVVKNNSIGVDFATAWSYILAFCLTAAAALCIAYLDPKHPYLLPVGVIATVGLLGPEVALPRYDVIIVILLYLTWRAHRNHFLIMSGVFLMLATALKLVPLLAFPVLFLATNRSQWWRLLVGVLIGAAIATAIPVLVIGWKPFVALVGNVLQYHSTRGVQIESMWSSAILFANALVASRPVPINFTHGAYQLDGNWEGITIAASLFTIGGTILIAWLTAQRNGKKGGDIGPGLIATMLLSLVASPVLSPQYMVWVLPLVIAYGIETGSRRMIGNDEGVLFVAMAVLIGVCTRWIYPLHYWNSIINPQLPTATFVLFLRNLLLLGVLFLFLQREGFVKMFKGTLRLLSFRTTRLKPAIVVSLSCFFVIASVVLFWAQGQLKPAFGSVHYWIPPATTSYEDVLPLSIASRGKKILMQFPVSFSALSSRHLHISPDDCLDQILINGQIITDPQFHYCGVDGRDLDVSPYVRSGENQFALTVTDAGGMQGVRIGIAPDWRQKIIAALLTLIISAEILMLILSAIADDAIPVRKSSRS